MIGKPTRAHPPCGEAAFYSVKRHADQAFEIEREFSPNVQRAVWAKAPVGAVRQQYPRVIGEAIEHMVTHVPPMGGRIHQIDF